MSEQDGGDAPREIETAHNAYVVVEKDKKPVLVLELSGREECYEISPRASAELRTAFTDGPQVRNDLEAES